MDPNEIIPGLFVGNMNSARDIQFFKNNNIKAVLNMTPDVPHYFASRTGDIEYMRLNVNDSLKTEDFNKMFKYFPSGISFIYKNLNLEGKNVLLHCLSEEHQILTNKGFLFLDEMEEMKEDVLIASYDEQSKQIVYEKMDKLIINGSQKQDMVEFTYNNEAYRWGENSDIYGRSQEDCRKNPSNGVSLVVTKGHDMYAKRGRRYGTKKQSVRWNKSRINNVPTTLDYQKIKADELLSNDERDRIKFLGKAHNGILQTKSIFEQQFVKVLGLDSLQKVNAFFEMYGYWLGDGSLSFSRQCGGKDAITLSPVKVLDKEWIINTLEILDLKKDVDWVMYTQNITDKDMKNKNRCIFNITNKSWVNFFRKEYQHKYRSHNKAFYFVEGTETPTEPENIKSAKWFCDWVWDLEKDQLQKILRGLRMADGNEANDENSIYTSSARFRDELMMVALHAGYSPHFMLVYEKSSERGIINGKTVKANHNNWRVSFNSSSQFSEPVLKQSRDVKYKEYTGRTWCVQVPHGFIITRRAHYDPKQQIVTKASRPIIAGNCHAGVQRSAAMAVAYLMLIYRTPLKKGIDMVVQKRPIAFSFGKSVNFMPALTKFAQFHKITF